MKNITGAKRIIIVCIALITFLRIIYIFAFNKIDAGEYITESVLSLNEEIGAEYVNTEFTAVTDRLDSVKLIFSGYGEESKNRLSVEIYDADSLIYDAKINTSDVNTMDGNDFFVNLTLERDKKYMLAIKTTEDALANGILENIYFTYVSYDLLMPKLLKALCWLVMCILGIIVSIKWNLITDIFKKHEHIYIRIWKHLACRIIVEVASLLIIYMLSGIIMSISTVMFLLVLSLVCVYFNHKRESYLKESVLTGGVKTLTGILYFLAAFMMVGESTFIYPFELQINLKGIFVYIIALVFFIPIINSGILLGEYICRISKRDAADLSKSGKKSILIFTVIVFGLILLPECVMLYAFNPGITNIDTYICMVVNAEHLYQMADWHPFFYCWVLKQILNIWNSTYAIIAVQFLFATYVETELLVFAGKKGVNKYLLYVIAFISGINPCNMLHNTSIYKDTLYTISVFWIFVVLVQMIVDYEACNKYRLSIELILALVGTCLYRQNGIATYLVVIISVIIYFAKSSYRWRAWITVFISVLAIVGVKGPMYSYYDVQSVGRTGMYVGLGQDILGVYYGGGEVNDKTMGMINVMVDGNINDYNYTPRMSHQNSFLDVSPVHFIGCYIDTFIHNPVLMTRSILERVEIIWNLYDDAGSGIGQVYYGNIDGAYDWNDRYPARKDNFMYSVMAAFVDKSVDIQWIDAIIWRAAISMLAMFVCLICLLRKRENIKYLMVLTPGVGHLIGVLLSVGWYSIRYYYALNYISLGMLVVLMLSKVSADNENTDN